MEELNEIKNKIKEIIVSTFGMEIPLEELKDEMPLINGGLFLDSIAIITLIVELEKEFNIKFEDEDLNLEGNNSIIALANYIASRIGD